MRKILIACITVVSVCILGCGKVSKDSAISAWVHPSSKLKVLSTTAMIDDLVKEIGGEWVLHRVLIQGELDPHSYELVKGDLEKFYGADLIFYNGLGLEHGASLSALLKKDKKTCAIGDEIAQRFDEKLVIHGKEIDPHIWMDLSLFSHAVDVIVERLCEKDKEHESIYRQRGQKLYNQLMELDGDIYQRMQSIPESRRYLITSHDAFFYFAKRYLSTAEEGEKWKERFAAPEGLAPDGQISPQDIQAMIDHAQSFGIERIFPESNLNQDGVKKIVSVLNKKGLKASLSELPLYGDTMGEVGSGAESYQKMMEHNAFVIEQGLNK